MSFRAITIIKLTINLLFAELYKYAMAMMMVGLDVGV
jgi:hypothetical protein